MLWVALHFPSLPSTTSEIAPLEAIAAWACQFTPKVALEPPHGLLLEVEGSLRYFGGREGLLAKVQSGLDELGFDARLAYAATARAASWLARSACGRLDDVPLEAVCAGAPLELLRGLGLATVAELRRLPREGLARRCGRALLEDLDRALGATPEAHTFFMPPARFSARLELAAPVAQAEALVFAARRLLVQLEGLLAARQSGVRGFELRLLQEDAEALIAVGLASPARSTERLTRVLQEKLSVTRLRRPVQALQLEAADFTPLPERSTSLFGEASAAEEGWAQLLERLRARLGHSAVFGLATHPDHRPELAWRRVEPGEWDPHEFRQPGPRPLWLVERKRLREGEFTLLAGPERIESGWWDGDEAARDYFVAQLADYSLAWIFREKEGWYLHGLFA